jgi:hypothetical protein
MPSRAPGSPEAIRRTQPPSKIARTGSRILMMDLLYFALTAVLFSLTWGLVRLCERV